MSNEEFVRCTNCGNLNIKGTEKCIFCDTDLSDAPISKEEASPEALAAVSETPKADVPSEVSEIPSEPKEMDIPIPKVPGVDFLEDEKEEKKPKEKEVKEEEIKVERKDRTQFSFAKKLLFITIFSFIIALVHYALNLLVSFSSFAFLDPNIQIPPIPNNLSLLLEIKGISIILSIIFSICIGYVFGKIVRIYSAEKSSITKWIVYALFIDILINFAAAIVLIVLTDALGKLFDILLIYLTGAVFIYVLFSVISLFIPILSGTFLIYGKIDRIFFPRKYKE